VIGEMPWIVLVWQPQFGVVPVNDFISNP